MRNVIATNALALAAVTLSALAFAGCSGAGAESVSATSAQGQTQALVAQAEDLFNVTGGDPLFNIPATLPGVATWSFYTTDQGTVAVGSDANGTVQTELALLVDSNGNIQGAGFAATSALGADGDTVLAGVVTDLQAATGGTDAGADAGDLTGQSVRILDDGVVGCANSVLSGLGSIGIGFFGVTAGVIVAGVTCPETLGVGCVAGVGIIVGSLALAGNGGNGIQSSCLGSGGLTSQSHRGGLEAVAP